MSCAPIDIQSTNPRVSEKSINRDCMGPIALIYE